MTDIKRVVDHAILTKCPLVHARKFKKKGKIMPHQKLRHGAGAICEVLLRYLHSRPVVSAKYPNASFNQHMGGLLCIQEEMKTINKKQVMCFVFRHNDFQGVKLHCVQ